jgi:hypothetical protein
VDTRVVKRESEVMERRRLWSVRADFFREVRREVDGEVVEGLNIRSDWVRGREDMVFFVC